MGAFRSDERVEHELPDLLRTAAGDHDLCGPLKGSLPCGHVDDGEASIQLHGLRVGAVVPFTCLRVGIPSPGGVPTRLCTAAGPRRMVRGPAHPPAVTRAWSPM